MAVVAPIPRASERMATIANPGFFPNIRNPYRASSAASLSHLRPHTSRVISFTNPTFPNPRRALRFFLLFAFLHAFPRRHLQMAPHFFIKLSLTLFSPPKTHGPPLHFLTSLLPISLRLHYSSGCKTPAIASESCDHLERSLVSCFFPADVNW